MFAKTGYVETSSPSRKDQANGLGVLLRTLRSRRLWEDIYFDRTGLSVRSGLLSLTYTYIIPFCAAALLLCQSC